MRRQVLRKRPFQFFKNVLRFGMKQKIPVFALLIVIASTGNSLAETVLPPPLPKGTPQEVEGFDSRALYNSYRNSISKDIEDASRLSIDRIRTHFSDVLTAKKLPKHGVSFSYYPVIQTREGERGIGKIYRACDRKKEKCDWVMKVVTVPIINASEWAYVNFDAVTAVAHLKARDIQPDDSISHLGFLMKLPSPKPHILTHAKKQLYYGKDCPAFMSALGSDYYGQERARYLMNKSVIDKERPTPKLVKGTVFDISILESADELDVYYAQPSIQLKFSRELGDEIGNKLFESIKDCPNRAGTEF